MQPCCITMLVNALDLWKEVLLKIIVNLAPREGSKTFLK